MKAGELQDAILAVLRDNGDRGAQAHEVARLLRERQGIDVSDRRVATNLTALHKSRRVDRESSYRRDSTRYFLAYTSNDTTVEELAETIVSVLDGYGCGCTAGDICRAIGDRHRKYLAIRPERIDSALRRLVRRGEVIESIDEGDSLFYGPASLRASAECPIQVTEELVHYTRIVVPTVASKVREGGRAEL